MHKLRHTAPLVTVFMIISVAVFMVWPAERRDYGACGQSFDCEAAFTAKLGGGLYYLQHLNKVDSSVASSTGMKFINVENENSVYIFSPVTVAVLAMVIGIGSTVVAVILRRVHRRRTAETPEQ